MSMLSLNWLAFKRGFKAMLPLWLGAIPFAVTYSIAAQKAGLSGPEIQLMSLMVSSAAAQMGIVQLLAVGASPVTAVLTAFAMSLHHLLYGLSLAKRLRMSRFERVTTAYFLTDAAYGLTIADKNNENPAFLFGAECSMFIVWNLFTAVGMLLSNLITIPSTAHLDFVIPLTFFILLISLIKSRSAIGVAILAAVLTWLCLMIQLGSATIFIAGIGAAFVWVLLVERRKQFPDATTRSAS